MYRRFLVMSREKFQNSENNCINIARGMESVVIKGFMNEPTRLKYVKCDRNAVTVLCNDEETHMNFAIDVVYQYDAEGFKKLREAFETEDDKMLEKEWQKAKPIIST